jgi:cysteine desulfurase/selenocysteine lyase
VRRIHPKSCSCAGRPRGSTSSRRAGAARIWGRATRSSSRRWSIIPVTDAGELDLDAAAAIIGERTKFVSLIHVSNALGTINPVEKVIALAKRHDIPVLLDGAQAISHGPVDVQALGCDFYVFSGHKLFGPTGIGVLWGRADRLEAMPPYQGGGNMIHTVTFEKTTYAPLPFKFEAGTVNIAGALGLHAAMDYVEGLSWDAIRVHEAALLAQALDRLQAIPGIRFQGRPARRAPVMSFTVDGIHPHDVGTVLDAEGIAVRAGHHCVQPLMARFGVPATIRASLSFYNTAEDVEALAAGIEKAIEVFRG